MRPVIALVKFSAVQGRRRGIGTLPTLITWKCYSAGERAPSKKAARRQGQAGSGDGRCVRGRSVLGLGRGQSRSTVCCGSRPPSSPPDAMRILLALPQPSCSTDLPRDGWGRFPARRQSGKKKAPGPTKPNGHPVFLIQRVVASPPFA